MIVLDTHVLLWLDREDPALGPSSRERIRTAWEKGSLAVCAISFWEVAMLAAALTEFHPDPPDRFIAAAAMARAATLITADQTMLRWSGPLLCHPAGR